MGNALLVAIASLPVLPPLHSVVAAMNRLIGLVSFLFLAGCVVGCSSRGPAAPSLAKVSGKVNLDGKPMSEGEIRFSIAGQPPKTLPIKDGAFTGEVHAGKNRVEVSQEKDGPPHPMDPKQRLKVNVVSDRFWGGNSTLSIDVDAKGSSDLKFEVTSARR